jgi:hypothetical protein
MIYNYEYQYTRKIIIEIKDLKKSYGDNHVLNGFLHEGETSYYGKSAQANL